MRMKAWLRAIRHLLACVITGFENTRDRVTRPSWHQRVYSQEYTIYWSETLLDISGARMEVFAGNH